MKKLLYTLLLSLPLGLMGQVFYPRTNGTFTPIDPYLSVPNALYIPKNCDTVNALHGGKDTIGALLWDVCNHKLWVRDTSIGTHKWKEVSAGTAITFPDGLLGASTNTPRVANDSDVVNTLNQFPLLHTSIFFRQADTIVVVGDSYVFGSGATNTAYRWSTRLANMLGAVEYNLGIAGSTVIKASPLNPFTGTNLIDRLSTIPPKNPNIKLIIIAMGLNDVGMANAPNYTVAQFRSNYDSAMHYITNIGYDPHQILIVSPYWIGQPGYTWYSGSNGGNGMPTVARHLQFVKGAQQTATKWGTMYFDIFHDQFRNDTTLISGDALHPTDAGHLYIARDIAQYLSYRGNLILGEYSPSAIPTPTFIDLGQYFSDQVGNSAKLKLFLYRDRVTPSSNFGLEVSSQNFGFHAGGNGTRFRWYVNNVGPVMRLGADGLLIDQNTVSLGSSTPKFLTLGGTYNTVAGDTVNMKFRIYDVAGNGQGGINLSSQNLGVTGQMEYITPYNTSHDFWIGPRLVSRIKTDGAYVIASLDTDNTPPTTSGTTKVTISDANGVLSQGPATSAISNVSTGTAAPVTTPTKVGDMYVDTVNKKLYVATGTASSADWTILN